MNDSDKQLVLTLKTSSPARSREHLQYRLNEGSQTPVQVTVTKNRHTMLSIAPEQCLITIRLHEAFLSAPECVIDALQRYLKSNDKSDWNIITDFAEGIATSKNVKRHPRKLRAIGKVYNLKELAVEVNRDFFNGNIAYQIGWARKTSPRKRKRRSIHYGTFCPETNDIRIHPGLDSDHVPVEFIKYIIFHEMLHAIIPCRRVGKRNRHHPPEFIQQENKYPGIKKMKQLAKTLLNRLD